MHKTLVLGALATTIAAMVGIAQSRHGSSAGFDAPAIGDGQEAVPPAGSLLLTLRLDAAGVTIEQATAKPDVAFRRVKDWETMPFRWVMRDAQGGVLAEGGFDPALLCLDPTHSGRPPHLQGDQLIPHGTHMNIKVPDLRRGGVLAFAEIAFSVRKADGYQFFGLARSESITIR